MFNKFVQFFRTRSFEYILLSLILVVGFVIRLYKIGNPVADWHSWRQADTASVTRIYINKGIDLLYPRYHDMSSIQTGILNPNGYRMVEFPIYNAIGALVSKTFTSISMEVWSRLITIACALVTSFFLYLIGRRFLGKWGGILSAAFYLFIPFNIYFTRVILPDPMGATFGVISLWLFIKFIDGFSNKLIHWSDLYLVLSAIFFSLMLLIKPYMGVYIIPIVYLAIAKFGFKGIYKKRAILFRSVVFLAIAFVPLVLWRMWEAKFPEGIPFYTWAFNGNGIRFKPSWWYWIFGERLGHLILGSFGIVPFIFGLLNTKVKNFFLHWFFVGMLFYVTAVASANVMHDYYQIPVMPSIALVLAAGCIYLWNQKVFNTTLTRLLLILSVLVMFLTGWNQIVPDYAINHPEILAAGKEIDRIAPKDVLVIAPYNGDTAFLYATNRSGWPAIDNSIDNIIKEGASYYVSVNLNDKDTKMITGRFKTIEKTDNFIIVDLTKSLPKTK